MQNSEKTGIAYWLTTPKGLFELFLYFFMIGGFLIWFILAVLAGIVTILFPL